MDGAQITNVKDSSYVVTFEDSSDINYICLYFRVGSRDDIISGGVHFFEHLLVDEQSQLYIELQKHNIIWSVETGKEYMVFRLNGKQSKLQHLLELITSSINEFNCGEEKDLERERSIIFQEQIARSAQPYIMMQDNISKALWGQASGLSHPIVGTAESINKIDSTIINQTSNLFHNTDIIVFSSGSLSHKNLVKFVNNSLSILNNKKSGERYKSKISITPTKIHKSQSNEISQVTFGYPFLRSNLNDSGIEPGLIAYIIGGPHSQLMKQARDRRGLVYNLICYPVLYRYEGFILINFYSSPENVNEIIDLIKDELFKRQQKGFSDNEIQQASQYLQLKYNELISDRKKFIKTFGDIIARDGKFSSTEEESLSDIFKHVDGNILNDIFPFLFEKQPGISILGSVPDNIQI